MLGSRPEQVPDFNGGAELQVRVIEREFDGFVVAAGRNGIEAAKDLPGFAVGSVSGARFAVLRADYAARIRASLLPSVVKGILLQAIVWRCLPRVYNE